MRHHIIEKLSRHVATGFNTEADVVYLFVEIGKYLEQIQTSDFNLIRFYRNWIVHSRLNRTDLAGDFAERLENLIGQIITQQELNVFEAATEEISRLVAFHNLFDELRAFFAQHGVRGDFATSEGEQERFSQLFISILADVPLMFSSERFKYLRIFSFQEVRLRGNIREPLASWYVQAVGYEFQGSVIF